MAMSFVDDIQQGGGLAIGVPNLIGNSAIEALRKGDVVIVPLATPPNALGKPGLPEDNRRTKQVPPSTE